MRIGVLGGGQLGRMLALAGYPLGLKFRFFEPSADPAVEGLAEVMIADFDDRTALGRFAEGLDVVTYEIENVPLAAAKWLAERLPVHPQPEALAVSQERFVEKTFFQDLGIPTVLCEPVERAADLPRAFRSVGWPAVLKTRRFGYDGRGQWLLRRPEDVDACRAAIDDQPLILESFVPFERELSTIAVRAAGGQTAFYPLVENFHHEGMLRRSIAPAPRVHPRLADRARDYAGRVLARLDYVGVLAIEWFEIGGELLANEMAPRVHNSGHWTIDAAQTSQFENHLRAIMGWSLGPADADGFSAMVNLVGEMPPAPDLLAIPGVHFHDYGKSPRPGRKLGHVTIRAATRDELSVRLAAISGLLPDANPGIP